ncbi:MAG TPA: class I SAM-dependent methyltransferase [Candidatus Dormibacteraeota bacterium]|nr:class I SAM-dependent methyltransferase [Candidatus Dormibacteraeota bacterium]
MMGEHEADSRPNPIRAYAHFEEYHWWFLARRRILRELVRFLLPPSKDTLIIDIGCGPGANIAAFAAGYHCIGIDTSAEAIEIARERYPMVEFVNGVSPGDLGSAPEAADLFLVMDVLEHIEHPRAMLESIVARASKDAYLLITVPADPDLWSPHDEAVGHYRRYTRETLAELVHGLPLETVMVSPYNARVYWGVKVTRRLARALRRGHGGTDAEGTDLRIPPFPLNGILTALFSQEAMPLARALREQSPSPFRAGVSLIAIFQKTEGEVRASVHDLPIGALTAKELGGPSKERRRLRR